MFLENQPSVKIYPFIRKIMKILIFLLTILPNLHAKEFRKSCLDLTKNDSECIDNDFFYSPSKSMKFRIFQVIARMEFSEPQETSIFYTYFKNNLAIVAPTRESTLSVNCYSPKNKEISKIFVDFVFNFNDCNRIIPISYRLAYDLEGADKIFANSRNKIKYGFYAKDNYLLFYGCAYNLITSSYDTAAWLLFKNSSYFAETSEELYQHLKIFLRNYNNNLISENDFKVNNLSRNSSSCQLPFRSKDTYKKIAMDFGLTRDVGANEVKSQNIRILIIGTGILMILLLFCFGVVNFVINYRKVRN